MSVFIGDVLQESAVFMSPSRVLIPSNAIQACAPPKKDSFGTAMSPESENGIARKM